MAERQLGGLNRAPGFTVIRRSSIRSRDFVQELRLRETLWNYARNRVADPGLILPSKHGLIFASASGPLSNGGFFHEHQTIRERISVHLLFRENEPIDYLQEKPF